MDSYLCEIARYPMMSPEEEIRLGRLVQKAQKLKKTSRPLTADEKIVVKRGERAKRRFVEANLRLVVYIAKKYAAKKPLNVDILDLVQEGSVGLMRAVEMYDPERGYKFSTYSYWWCRQAMSRALNTQERLIRRPHTVIELASKMPKAITEEAQRLGRAPTARELAAKLNVKEEEIHLLRERGCNALSLDALFGERNDCSMYDTIADPVSVNREDADRSLDVELKMPVVLLALSSLMESERTYIEMRYGLNGHQPHTYDAIAKEVGLSRERVRQVLDRGVRKLRYQMALHQQQLADSRTDAEPLELAMEYSPTPYRGPVTPLNQFPKAAEVQALQYASSHCG